MGNSNSKKEAKKKAEAAEAGRSAASASISSSTTNPALEGQAHDSLAIKEQMQLDEPPVYVSGSAVDYQPAESSGAVATVETQEEAVGFWSREKTFRPQRAVPDSAANGKAGRIMRTVQATMKATLGGGDLEQAVKCPPGEDRQEWLAVNCVQFFNAASLIYGTVQQYCTVESCPAMVAGKASYLWKDGSAKYKKPTSVPACVYIDLAMTEIDEQITDPSIFPIDSDDRFPRDFEKKVCRSIFKRLFRLYAHIYCAHHDKIRSIGAAAHLNTTFKHLVTFIIAFDLVSAAEMQPLAKLIARFAPDAVGAPK